MFFLLYTRFDQRVPGIFIYFNKYYLFNLNIDIVPFKIIPIRYFIRMLIFVPILETLIQSLEYTFWYSLQFVQRFGLHFLYGKTLSFQCFLHLWKKEKVIGGHDLHRCTFIFWKKFTNKWRSVFWCITLVQLMQLLFHNSGCSE